MSSFAWCRTTSVLIIGVAAALGCGGDTGTGPGGSQPPDGSANRVPRVLGLSTASGKSPPAMQYQLSTVPIDIWTDSGSATLQDDSMLVVRTYGRMVARGSGQSGGTPFPITAAGRLGADGIALFHYTDGTVDTAHVLGNGSIVAQLTISDGGTRPFGTFAFASPYHGDPLNPVVYVKDIAPPNAPEYADSAVVTLTGSSFLPTTQVHWDKGTPLSTTYLSPYQISAVIPGLRLGALGKHTLTVTNPAPGGGDRIFEFDVTVPEPAIMSLAPAVMPVGGGDFTMRVHGRGFVGATQVLWNGVPRAATWVSPTDLDVQVRQSDLQAPGTVTVAVQTLPANAGGPGGGTSGVVYFTIAASSTAAQTLSDISVPIAASQIFSDPTRTLVYAIAGTPESTWPHEVIALDPTSGQTVWSLDLAMQIGPAAISDDGQYLYLAAPTDSIIRLALATHAVDGSIQLGGSPGSYRAVALAVAPGMPQRLAVVQLGSASLGGAASLHVFDGTQQLGAGISGTHPGMIAFGTAQTLYGVDPPEAYGAALTYAVSSSGVVLNGTQPAGLGSGCCVLRGSRAYTRTGHVYDMSTDAAIDIPGFATAQALVPSDDGALVYSITVPGNYVRAYDVQSLQEIGAVTFNGPGLAFWGVTGGAVRWGKDGLAFPDNISIHFVRVGFVH